MRYNLPNKLSILHIGFQLAILSDVALCWIPSSTTINPSSFSTTPNKIRRSYTSSSNSISSHSHVLYSTSTNKDMAVDSVYYGTGSGGSSSRNSMLSSTGVSTKKSKKMQQKITLTRYLNGVVQEQPELRELESLLLSVQMACKTISNMLNRAGINEQQQQQQSSDTATKNNDNRSRSMKRLDQICTNVIQNALRFSGKVSTIARTAEVHDFDSTEEKELDQPKEHQPGVLIATALDSKYIAYIDPLDGSGNADAGIPTGTIFGIFPLPEEDEMRNDTPQTPKSESELIQHVLQPGANLQAAGYCLYSSSTIFVFSIKSINNGAVHSFTLDPTSGEFILTATNMTVPKLGSNVYSCNEANSIGWDEHLLGYIYKLKSGDNFSERRYALRYIGSLVADIHRTILYGGIFMYPSDTIEHPRGNLQLLYKAMPLGYLLSNAGGIATNGTTDLLNVLPKSIHQRSPCFMGSRMDMQEMMDYLPHDDF